MIIYEIAGKRPVIEADSFVHPTAVIIGEVRIGSGCFIGPSAVLRADCGPITIGDGSSIQDNATVHVDPGAKVDVGRNVIVGHNVVIHDVTLHDECVIGMGAVLLANVVCGTGVVVAAGSVVKQGMNIPAGKLVIGNPAKIVKDVSPELKAYVKAGIEQYKEMNRVYRETMKEIPF